MLLEKTKTFSKVWSKVVHEGNILYTLFFKMIFVGGLKHDGLYFDGFSI